MFQNMDPVTSCRFHLSPRPSSQLKQSDQVDKSKHTFWNQPVMATSISLCLPEKQVKDPVLELFQAWLYLSYY